MRKLFPFSLALVLLLISTAYSQQRPSIQENSRSEKRVALVIGNSAYETSPLKNPVNDAQDMAQTLRGLRFDVIYRENLNKNDMKRAIREFGAKIQSGSVGLFYYAGHGVQVQGVNYLVPVDAKVEREEEIEFECVDAGFVLAQMSHAKNSMNIVILDACRNNPFARSYRSTSRGLALMGAPTGTLIAYSTEPGSVASDGKARNGIYTQELLKLIKIPNLDIEDVFKRVRVSVLNLTQRRQTPWESSSLEGDFYFNGTNGEKAERLPLPNRPLDPAAVELTYWETIKDSSDPEDFREYLEKYPDGQFASLARRRAQSTSDGRPTIGRRPNRDDDSGVLSPSPIANQGVKIWGVACMCEQFVMLKAPNSLTILGDGWDGGSDVKLLVNGKDISTHIDSQNANIFVKGSIKELNLRDGRNEVVIIVNGITSNTYVLKQAIKPAVPISRP